VRRTRSEDAASRADHPDGSPESVSVHSPLRTLGKKGEFYMKKTLDITCLCGAVHVRLSGEPAVQFYCHCDDCQAANGGAYVAVALYSVDAVSHTEGELATWTLKTMPRRRCAVCGTQVLAEVPGGKQLQGLGILYAYDHDRVDDAIARGMLRCILADWSLKSPGLYLYYAKRRHLQPALRSFIDCLLDRDEAAPVRPRATAFIDRRGRAEKR
jgi:hypothetical protein